MNGRTPTILFDATVRRRGRRNRFITQKDLDNVVEVDTSRENMEENMYHIGLQMRTESKSWHGLLSENVRNRRITLKRSKITMKTTTMGGRKVEEF